VATRPTGRGQETVEIPPERCPNGHEIGPGKVIVGYGPNPDGFRARSWLCRRCGALTWDQPD
jgi:hypothetical protein